MEWWAWNVGLRRNGVRFTRKYGRDIAILSLGIRNLKTMKIKG